MLAIGAVIGASPAQTALAWILAQGEDIAPIPGTRRATTGFWGGRLTMPLGMWPGGTFTAGCCCWAAGTCPPTIPPSIEFEQAKGFALYAMRTVLDGKGTKLLDLAKANLRQLF